MGIKGYVTNIAEQELFNTEVIDYYHSLWNVESADTTDLPLHARCYPGTYADLLHGTDDGQASGNQDRSLSQADPRCVKGS